MWPGIVKSSLGFNKRKGAGPGKPTYTKRSRSATLIKDLVAMKKQILLLNALLSLAAASDWIIPDNEYDAITSSPTIATSVIVVPAATSPLNTIISATTTNNLGENTLTTQSTTLNHQNIEASYTSDAPLTLDTDTSLASPAITPSANVHAATSPSYNTISATITINFEETSLTSEATTLLTIRETESTPNSMDQTPVENSPLDAEATPSSPIITTPVTDATNTSPLSTNSMTSSPAIQNVVEATPTPTSREPDSTPYPNHQNKEDISDGFTFLILLMVIFAVLSVFAPVGVVEVLMWWRQKNGGNVEDNKTSPCTVEWQLGRVNRRESLNSLFLENWSSAV